MPLTLDTFLAYRLNRLAEATSDEIRPVYRERYGMNRPEWRTLIVLHDLSAATATEICKDEQDEKQPLEPEVNTT